MTIKARKRAGLHSLQQTRAKYLVDRRRALETELLHSSATLSHTEIRALKDRIKAMADEEKTIAKKLRGK